VPLAALVQVAGTRWQIVENFQASKGLAALDQHQVRTWISWHRWTVLAMLAHAFLAVTAAAEHRAHAVVHMLIPLTGNEIRHLLVSLREHAQRDIEHVLRWSRGRRPHQAHARACHYKRREHVATP